VDGIEGKAVEAGRGEDLVLVVEAVDLDAREDAAVADDHLVDLVVLVAYALDELLAVLLVHAVDVADLHERADLKVLGFLRSS